MSDTPKPPNLVAFPGDGKPDELAKHLRFLKENLATLHEFNEIDAQIRRKKYEALLKQGFSESQALTLCQR